MKNNRYLDIDKAHRHNIYNLTAESHNLISTFYIAKHKYMGYFT